MGHWERYARKHKKHGAYRAAVSFYYKMIREHGDELREVKKGCEREAMQKGRVEYGGEDMRVFRDGKIFFWVKFEDVEECRRELFRLAG